MSRRNSYGRAFRRYRLAVLLLVRRPATAPSLLLSLFLLILPFGALVAVAALPPLDVAHGPQPGQPAATAAVARTSAGEWLLIETGGDIGAGTGSVRRRSLSLTGEGVPEGGDVIWDAGVLLTGQGNAEAPAAPSPGE